MAHYLIINTGGTIGMVPGPKGLVPNADEMEKAFAFLPGLSVWQDHKLTWQHWSPLLDSSNLQPEHWYSLRDQIQTTPDADGILIIHGTDTLAYSAAALSFLLADLDRPVVITGSMLPIADAKTDAIDNLILSLNGLQSGKQEVMVAVGNHLLPASRTTKSTTFAMDAFSTPAWTADLWEEAPAHSNVPNDAQWHAPNIPVITLHPGITFDNLLPAIEQKTVSALLINAYGNGNAANSAAMKQLLETARQNAVPVLVRSQCHEGDVNFGLYEASQLFTDAGAISCGSMPLEAALTKLQIICSQWSDQSDILREFQTPYAREWQAISAEH